MYAGVNKIASSTIVNAAWEDYIRSIIEGAIGFMGNAVTSRIPLSSLIDPYTRDWLRSGDYSQSLGFPTNVTSDYHFYIQFRPKDLSIGTRGYAVVCQRTASGAPTIAIIDIDSKITVPWSISQQRTHRERDFHNILHEIAHAFDVFQGLASYWKDPATGNAYTDHVGSFSFNDGNTWPILQISAITTFLKDYLNCPSAPQGQIPGLPLFTNPDHIVTKIFPLESIVSGYSYSDKRSSELALRLIAATSFGTSIITELNHFRLEKNTGCNFINPPTSPNPYEGFCNSSVRTRRCTFHRNHWSPCKNVASSYLEKVVYTSENNLNWCWNGHTLGNNYESFEVGSKCFESSRSTIYCLQNSCVWLTGMDLYQIRLRSPNETQLARCNFKEDQETLSGTSELIPHF